MYAKIEPTGYMIKKRENGIWIGVMCRFYLEPGDPGYDKYSAEHSVTIPEDKDDYTRWLEMLPRDDMDRPILPNPDNRYEGYPGNLVKRLNPFLNHRLYLDPTATDEEILDIMEKFLKIAAQRYAEGKDFRVFNLPLRLRNSPITTQRMRECERRMRQLKMKDLNRRVIR